MVYDDEEKDWLGSLSCFQSKDRRNGGTTGRGWGLLCWSRTPLPRPFGTTEDDRGNSTLPTVHSNFFRSHSSRTSLPLSVHWRRGRMRYQCETAGLRSFVSSLSRGRKGTRSGWRTARTRSSDAKTRRSEDRSQKSRRSRSRYRNRLTSRTTHDLRPPPSTRYALPPSVSSCLCLGKTLCDRCLSRVHHPSLSLGLSPLLSLGLSFLLFLWTTPVSLGQNWIF